MATGAYYGNPNIQRQGEKARQIAQQRNVSDIADPRTYGFMQGLFGTAPDQLGYSVFDDPATKQAAQKSAEVGFVGGGLLGSLPILGPALRGYGRLAAGQVNRAMMGEGGLLGPITPQPMYVVPPGKGVKPINLSKGIYKPDLTMEEMLKVRDIPTVDRVRQSIDLIGEKEFEKMVNAKYSQYKPSNPDQEAMLVESVTLDVLGRAQRSPYPQQVALDLAQQRAALPVEQGGLGLPVGNTPEMRAMAMNAEDVYHGTNVEKQILNDLNFSLDADQRGVGGIWTTKDKNYASWLADQKDKKNASVMSLKLLNAKNSNEYDILQEGIKLADEIGAPIPKNALEAQELLAGGYGWDRVISDLLSQSKAPNLKITNFNDAYHSNPNEVTKAFITKDPNLLRLPNAAFDPFRRNAAIATAMGVALPDLLAQPLSQYQPSYETSPMYSDPFGNTIGSSIR